MNYTKNYHLPQWDENDRIMRADFNRMCADMEAGLTGNAETAEKLQQSSSAQNKQTVDRLFRSAYNHYCLVENMDPFPGQTGVFHQNFGKDPSGSDGTVPWNGSRFAGKNRAPLNSSMLTQSYQQITPLRIVKNNLAASTPMTAKFKAPASGCVNNYSLIGNFINSDINASFRLRFTLTNQKTGGIEYSSTATFTNQYDNAGFSYFVNAPLYFLGGTEYLITVYPLDAICDMQQAGLAFGDRTVVQNIANEGIVTAARTFYEPEGGSGGMAVLRCVIGGEGGTLRFLWDGAERQPDFIRIARMGSGQAFEEYVYLRSDSISPSSSLSLRFECNDGGSFLLHDWGMMMF